MFGAVKTGNEGGKDAVDGDPCWESIRKSVNPIKKHNKVVYSSTTTEPCSNTETGKGNQRTERLTVNRSHLRTSLTCTPYENSRDNPRKPQFICTEEHGIISGIDSGTKTKVDRGKFKIDATIDLHGYSTSMAYDLLVDFVIDSFERARKCILVITGWGSKRAGENSLRSNLHHWLQSDQIVNLILYYKQATPAHGGRGAFYVLLRKNKQKRISPKDYKEDL